MNAEHRKLFMQRWKLMKEARLTHPWARWIAVDDAQCAPACRELYGRVWHVDGEELAAAVDAHIKAKVPNCRCRLQPLSDQAMREREVK